MSASVRRCRAGWLVAVVVAASAGSLVPASAQRGAAASSSQAAGSKPASLLAAQAARAKQWGRGRVWWHTRSMGPPRQTMYFVSRFAGDDEIVTQRDDGSGGAERGVSTDSMDGWLNTWARSNGETWSTDGWSISARVLNGQRAAQMVVTGDLRAADLQARGIGPGPTEPSVDAALWACGLEKAGAIRYEERRDGALEFVSIKYGGAGKRAAQRRHWIDPARGWIAIRSEFLIDGKVRVKTVATPTKFGDVWFPGKIVSRSVGPGGAESLITDLTVERAEFGGALPESFRPEDIGIEPGTNIMVEPTPTRPGALMTWDGKRLISFAEFRTRLATGELKQGPNLVKSLAASRPAPATPREDPLLDRVFRRWDVEVDSFAVDMRLDERQALAARSILSDCKEAARRHRDLHRQEFDEYAAMAWADATDPAHRPRDRFQKMSALERKLTPPLEEIARRSLRPRLEALLTATQRHADQVPASGPTGG